MPGASDIRAGRAYVELFTKDGMMVKGLERAQKRLIAFGNFASGVGKSLTIAGAAAAAPLAASVKIFSDVGGDLQDMSQRTGITVEALSQFAFATDQSATDMETFEKAVRKMQQNLVDAALGGKEAAQAFTDLGLSVDALKTKTPDQQFLEIADRISKIRTASLRTSAAMNIFGKSGAALLPLMSDGAKGIRDMMQAADAAGLTIRGKDAAAAEQFGDKLNLLKRVVGATAVSIGGALEPTLSKIADTMTAGATAASKWVQEHGQVIAIAAGGVATVTALGNAFYGFSVALQLGSQGLGILKAGLTTVGTIGSTAVSLFLNPWTAIPLVIAAATAAVFLFTDSGQEALTKFGEAFSGIISDVQDTVGGVVDALSAGDFELAAQVAMAGLNVVWRTGLASLTEVWSRFKDSVLRLWIDMRAKIQSGWAQMFAELSRAFPGLMEIAAKAGMFLKGIFQTIARKTLELTGVITAEESKQAAEQLVKDNQAELRASIDEISRAHDDPSAFVESELAKIEADRKAAQEARERGASEDISAAEEALKRARHDLQDSVGKAREARQAADEKKAAEKAVEKPKKVAPDLDEFAQLIGRQAEAAKHEAPKLADAAMIGSAEAAKTLAAFLTSAQSPEVDLSKRQLDEQKASRRALDKLVRQGARAPKLGAANLSSPGN